MRSVDHATVPDIDADMAPAREDQITKSKAMSMPHIPELAVRRAREAFANVAIRRDDEARAVKRPGAGRAPSVRSAYVPLRIADSAMPLAPGRVGRVGRRAQEAEDKRGDRQKTEVTHD
jgi:hypothetical protein